MKYKNNVEIFFFALQMRQIASKVRKRREAGHQMTWTDYHSQEDMDSFLDYLEEKYKGMK